MLKIQPPYIYIYTLYIHYIYTSYTHTHTHTHTHTLSNKKNKVLPYATTWMDLEYILLSEMSNTETNAV